MADAVKTPNVVEATNKPGLYSKLEDLKKRWVPTPAHTGDVRPCRPRHGFTHRSPWGPVQGLQRSNHTPSSPETPRSGAGSQ